jgi:ABC-type lipoprotein release transport system permease subunit
MLVSIFAALAALLAAVGIYGAIAFSVAQRTREFGLRMALGAMPAAIRRLTLARTTRLTLTGAACGLAVSLILGQLLQSALYLVPHQHSGLIYGVGIRDPLSLSAAAAIVLALAAMASLAPAGRAARVEPSAACVTNSNICGAAGHLEYPSSGTKIAAPIPLGHYRRRLRQTTMIVTLPNSSRSTNIRII